MTLKKIMGTTAILAAFAFATPAMAQSTVTEGGPGSADNNGNAVANDFLDLLSNNANGNNRNNDANDNGNNRDNEANDNGNNRGNVDDFLDLLSNNNNGNNRDNQANDNGNNRDNEANGNTDTSGVTAIQTLVATNLNQHLDEVVDLDGEDNSDTNVGYQSGDNHVGGNAFAAFAGINSSAWNTGINNNVQSGVNIAAQGNVSFGDAAGCCPAAGGPGDD